MVCFSRLSGVECRCTKSAYCAGVQIPVSPQACSLIDKRVGWLCHSSLTFVLVRNPHGSPSRMYEQLYMRGKWVVVYIVGFDPRAVFHFQLTRCEMKISETTKQTRRKWLCNAQFDCALQEQGRDACEHNYHILLLLLCVLFCDGARAEGHN